MKILVNGKKIKFDSNLTLHMLLIELDFISKRIAVEVNEEIITRSHFKNKLIVDGDKIEIINAVGGG